MKGVLILIVGAILLSGCATVSNIDCDIYHGEELEVQREKFEYCESHNLTNCYREYLCQEVDH